MARVGFFWFKGQRKAPGGQPRAAKTYMKKKLMLYNLNSIALPNVVKLTPKVILRLYPNGSNKFRTVHSSKPQRIYHQARHAIFTKSHLKVIYAPDTINEGIYFNRQDLTAALHAFLEMKHA